MLSLRSIACTAAALLMVSSTSALPAAAPFEVVRREAVTAEKMMLRRASAATSMQGVLNTLQSQTSTISSNMKAIANAAPTTPSAQTAAAMNDENSSLEAALNTAVEGVTKLLGQVKGDVNLLNLAGTITNIIADLLPALATVEAGLSEDPALAPLVATLAGLLNGPLLGLITLLEGVLVGLLPIVQALLAALGLTPLLLGLQGTVDSLLTGLGL